MFPSTLRGRSLITSRKEGEGGLQGVTPGHNDQYSKALQREGEGLKNPPK